MKVEESNGWIRRQALNIASQLPEETERARAILSIVAELVDFFEFPPPKEELAGADHAVLRFPGGPNSPSRRARSTGSPPGFPK